VVVDLPLVRLGLGVLVVGCLLVVAGVWVVLVWEQLVLLASVVVQVGFLPVSVPVLLILWDYSELVVWIDRGY
jgi:hypothetical protein